MPDTVVVLGKFSRPNGSYKILQGGFTIPSLGEDDYPKLMESQEQIVEEGVEDIRERFQQIEKDNLLKMIKFVGIEQVYLKEGGLTVNIDESALEAQKRAEYDRVMRKLEQDEKLKDQDLYPKINLDPKKMAEGRETMLEVDERLTKMRKQYHRTKGVGRKGGNRQRGHY